MRRIVVVVGAGVLALCVACSGASPGVPDSDGSRPGGGTSAAPAGPGYDGPALPGLSAKPLWSVRHQWQGVEPGVFELGDTVVLVNRDDNPSSSGSTAAGGPQWSSPPSVLEFRDVATGQVRTTVEVPVDTVRRDTWAGKPVVVVHYHGVQPSDGLSKEKPIQVVAGYDASGAEVGRVEAPGDPTQVAVVAGRVIRPGADGRTRTVSIRPITGGRGITVSCALEGCGYMLSADEPAAVGDGSNRVPALLGDLVFSLEDPGDLGGVRLVALDAATGTRRWTSASIPTPPGVAAEDDLTGVRVAPVAMVGGKLVLSWWAAGSPVGRRIAALHEPATGALLAAGPQLPEAINTVLPDSTQQRAVLSANASSGDVGSAAWDLASGKVLWQQTADEKPLAAEAVVNGVVYGRTVSDAALSSVLSETYVALDLPTKRLLARDLALARPPIVTPTGHGLVRSGEALYVFGPAG